MAKKLKKIMFFVTEDWYFVSHRLSLAIAAKTAGFDVSVITRVRSHGELIRKTGLKIIPIELSRRGSNPLKELIFIKKLVFIYKSEQPSIVHNVSLKPVLYGSLASLFVKKLYIVNALTGLGFLFSSNSLKARILRPLVKKYFRFLLNRRNIRVILQNPDDERLFVDGNILKKTNVNLIRGSGVDSERFHVTPEPPGQIVVILASRLLWDKGVGEFVEAAKLLRQEGVEAKFVLVGEGDKANPASIADSQLSEWHEKGYIEWWGRCEDMPGIIAQAHIVCLPSYREGVPKVLIEAASCGRPIVTTDAPGCREIVKDGVNGFLVPIRDQFAVANALKKLILSRDLRRKMGVKGRELVKREFTQEIVNAKTLKLYKDLLQ